MAKNSLTLGTKLLYGFGDIGFSLTSTILGAFFAIFLTDVVGMAPGIAAIAIFVGRSSDYINDPLIGHLTDRTRTRWGRRRPYLLFGAIPFGLAFCLLWLRPPFESQIALAVYYALAYLLFDIAATFVYMPYFALTPELTSDYDERTSLTSFRMFFSIVGSLIAFTIPILIVGGFNPQNLQRVALMGAVFGAASAIPLFSVFFGSREREEYMQQEQPGLRDSFKAAIKNKPFIFGAVIFLLTWVSIDILQAALLYFVKYILGRESQSDLIMAVIFITAMISLPLWNFAAHHWDKRTAYITGISFWAVVQVVLITTGSATPIAWVIFLCVLAGIGVGAAHVLPWSILPDAIEWDEWQTGTRHEGMFYSLITLMQKIASSLSVPLILLLLEFSGYLPNSAVQPESALFSIRLAVGLIPALLLCGGLLFAALYPLKRVQFQTIVKDLETRRHSAASDD